MADYKNYDELLKQYEPKQEPKRPEKDISAERDVAKEKNATEQKNATATPKSTENSPKYVKPIGKTETGSIPVTSSSSNKRAAPPPLTQDRNNFKGGVYFSNPPQKKGTDATKSAGRSGVQRATANGNNPNARRKANVQGKKKSNANDNAFIRFLKSKGLKRFGIMVAVIAVVSTILCIYGIGCINDVLGISDDNISVEVTIEQGMTDDEVIDLLEEKGLINNKLFCKLFIKFFEKEGPYISNTYTLTPQMGVEKMIAIMKTDYTLGEIVTLTFPEGWNARQIAEKLEANDVCTASSFMNTLQTVDFSEDYDFIAAIHDKSQRFIGLEGYLYPDTYQFYVGENPSSVIRRFLNNFEVKWTEEYGNRASELGLTIDEVITLASIIQMEAANYDQMPGVSSVLHNRLDNTYTFPRLECDSTTAYYTDVIAPSYTTSSEDMKKCDTFRNLYDTYDDDCLGLPIGAIANPGGDAISAALYPDDTGYYFFNHDVNGGIYYAVTASEHDRNVALAESVEPE